MRRNKTILLVAVAMVAIIVYRHRDNLRRLRAGKEHKV